MKSREFPIYRVFRAGLLLLTVSGLGCSSAPASSESGPEAEAVGIPVLHTGPIHETGYCGYKPLGRDDEGRKLVEAEYYPYKEWNRQLAQDPALRAATGFEQVSTCEDARAFSAVYYDVARTPLQGDAALTNTLPPDLPTYVIGETDEPKARNLQEAGDSEKILDGQPTSNRHVVQWLYKMDEVAVRPPEILNTWESCTAVRIAGPLFLTAAHCIAPYPLPDEVEYYQLQTIHMRFMDGAGSHWYRRQCREEEERAGTCNENVLSARVYIHPVYRGGLRTPDVDMALLYIIPRDQDGLRFQFQEGWTNWYSWIATQLPKPPDDLSVVGWGHLSVYGWGPVSIAEGAAKDPLPYQQRSFPNLAAVPILPSGVKTFTAKETVREKGKPTSLTFRSGTVAALASSTNALPAGSSPIAVCHGDSGGPAFSPANTVVALIAQGEPTVGTTGLCANPDSEMRFARTDLVRDWLVAGVRKIQNGEGKVIPNTCSCGFVGPASDPENPNNPQSYLTCAIGCGDPGKPIVE